MDIRSEYIREILRLPPHLRVHSLELALQQDNLSDGCRRVLEQDLTVCLSKCKLKEATLNIQCLQSEHNLAVETLLQLKRAAGLEIKEQRKSTPKISCPAISAADGQHLSQTRPQSIAVTFLLSLADMENNQAHNKLLRRVKHLQHELQGIERVCLHGLAGHIKHQRKAGRKGCGKGKICYIGPRRAGWKRHPRDVDQTSVIHRSSWAAPWRGFHVELRAWDAGWAGHAMNRIAELVGIGAIKQIWLVLRNGCVHWLRAYGPHLEGFDFASVTPASRYKSIVPDALIEHDEPMLVQCRWDASRKFGGLVRDVVELKQHLESIRFTAVHGFADEVEWSLATNNWAHEPLNLFASVAARHKVVFSMRTRRETRLCLIGNSEESIRSAQEDLRPGGQAAVSFVEYGWKFADDNYGEQWISHFLCASTGWKVLSDLNVGIVLQCGMGVRIGAFSDFKEWFMQVVDGQQEVATAVTDIDALIAEEVAFDLTAHDEGNKSILDRGSALEVVEFMLTSRIGSMTIAANDSSGYVCDYPFNPLQHNDIKVHQYMPNGCEVAVVLSPYRVLVVGRRIIVGTLHALFRQIIIGRKTSEEANALVQSMSHLSHLMPDLPELVRFVQAIPDMYPSDDAQLLPVAALRFTHHTVNGEFAFGEDHENCQESILKLFLALFQGSILPEKMEPLYVFLHEAPHGSTALYSRNNRCLLALQMLQACRRDVLVHVPCFVRESSDQRQAPVGNKSLAQWFAEGYDGADSSKGCNGKGLSIWSRSQRANHRGYPIMNPAETTILALGRLWERSLTKVGTQAEQIEALEILRSSLKKRQIQDDEETLSLLSRTSIAPGKGKGGTRGRWRRWGAPPHDMRLASECHSAAPLVCTMSPTRPASSLQMQAEYAF